jgi:hypothetical protein
MEDTTQSSVSDDAKLATDTTPQRGNPNEDAASQRETAGDETIRDPEKKRLHEEAVSHKLRAKQLEAQLKVYQDAEQQAEDAKRSEIERVTKQHKDTEARYNTIALELKEERMVSAVYRYAPKMNFILSPERIAQFITRSEVEFDESGKPTNIEKLLTALAKAEPDLVKKIEDTPAPTPQTKPNAPALPTGNPGRTSIAPPSSLPSGTRPSLAEAYRLAKK